MRVARLLMLISCIVNQVFPAAAEPELVVPGFIQAFGNDVPVRVKNATMGDVIELFANNQTEPITAQVITSARKSSEELTLIFNCGYFFETGSYTFKLRSPEGKNLATSQEIIAADRPEVTLEWEKRHEVLTRDVKVSLKVRGELCKSGIARQNKLSLNLMKMGNETGRRPAVIQTFPIMQSPESFIPSYIVLPCETFKKAGVYQTELIVTPPDDDDVTLSESDTMKVDWSKDYDLKLLKHSFPCTGTGVTVVLSFPPCASTEDAVRLLSVSDGIMTIMAEEKRLNGDHVTFPCSTFYNMNRTVEGLCFQYIVEGGYVARTVCEPVNEESDFKISGSWSPWTSWSTCDRPCQKNMKRRKRICDNPQPYGEGKQCKDELGQDSLEELVIRHTSSMSWGSCDDMIMTSSIEQQCDCGCSLQTEDKGAIVSSLTDSCDYMKTLIWTVSVPHDHVILFKLADYQLARDEVLTVRDGRTSYSMTSQFPTVVSQKSVVIVQWVKSNENNNLKSCGFILSYEAIARPTSDPGFRTTQDRANSTSIGVGDWIEKTVGRNPVVLAGIGACLLIIAIVIIVFVSVRCKRSKQKKGKVPPGLNTPMNTRLAMPPDGRSCSNADDTESEPMVRPRPIGNVGKIDLMNDTCIPMQPSVGTGTAYYLAQRQLELMRRLGKDEHSQTYATGCLSDEALRDQEDLLFGDRSSLHKNEELKVT